MSIYHCSISNVSRGKGSSTCATLSYITASKIFDERTRQTFHYGRGERVLYVATLVPENAPKEFENPSILFNSIEKYEKAENARTGKKIEVALPREFDIETQQKVIENYIKNNLTKEGYCATYAIHTDKKNNNPHAHILIANRTINNKGEWAIKRKMEYVLDENGERIPRIDKNGEQIKDKNGRKQWKRKSVEQNLLDKKEFLVQLRENWAKECNHYLSDENFIDHRSYEERRLDLVPTIHEGYASREMEKRGEVSDRAEINRRIKAINLLIKEIINKLIELLYEHSSVRILKMEEKNKLIEKLESDPIMESLKKAIVDFKNNHYGLNIKTDDFYNVFPDLEHIVLSEEKTADNLHTIEFTLNLNQGSWTQFIDGKEIDSDSYEVGNGVSPLLMMYYFLEKGEYDKYIYPDSDFEFLEENEDKWDLEW